MKECDLPSIGPLARFFVDVKGDVKKDHTVNFQGAC